MKQLSRAEKLAAKKWYASVEAHRRAKIGLIKAAHKSKSNNLPPDGWSESDEAHFHRRDVNSDFIEKRGRFPKAVVYVALNDRDWETKESVAAWLRTELKSLRDAERTPGAAPVRRGKALSRIEISEIAVELLECIGGEQLIYLFQELLDIDRHRKSLADDQFKLDQAAQIEATAELQGDSLGVRSLADRMSVSPSTVTRWRKSRPFLERVQFFKDILGRLLRYEYFERIKTDLPQATDAQCFRRAFQMYIESLPHRQEAVLKGRRATKAR
jgi:hypothetical protein